MVHERYRQTDDRQICDSIYPNYDRQSIALRKSVRQQSVKTLMSKNDANRCMLAYVGFQAILIHSSEFV